MQNIFLISQNEDLQKAIAAGITSPFTVTVCAHAEEAQAHCSAEETACPTILIDLSGENQPENRLAGLKQEGAFLLAILDDPAKREAAFRAGVDDYLLLPISANEIAARVVHSIQYQEKIKAQRRLIGDQERGVSIGRLVSHICHEINNSMQATRGALALAMEEPDIPEELDSYLHLCEEETRRVVALVKKMRQIYHSADALPTDFFLDSILKESIALAADEMNSDNVRLVMDLEKDIPPIRGNCDLIQVALLSLLLNVSQTLSKFDGGDIKASLAQVKESIQLELLAESSKSNLPNFTTLSPADEIITGQGGKVTFRQEPPGISIQILFPISKR